MKKPKPKKTEAPELKYTAWESATALARRLQASYNAEMTRHNETIYWMLAGALVVRKKYEDDAEWQTQCDESFWEKREPRYRPNTDTNSSMKSHYTAAYLFAGKNFARINRAQKYGRILHHYYNLGVEPEKLKAKLTADGGIEAVLKKVAENDPRYKRLDNEQPPEPQAKDIYGDDFVADDAEEEYGAENDDVEQKSTESGKAVKSQAAKENHWRLYIDLTEEEFEEAMNWPIDEKIRVVAVREAAAGKYKPFRATSFGPYTKKRHRRH
jgi:hypothetical protein